MTTCLVVGHPYVDVWQAVRSERLGLAEWPTVPAGTAWKEGVLAVRGWPHASDADVARAWRRILARCAATRTWSRRCCGRWSS